MKSRNLLFSLLCLLLVFVAFFIRRWNEPQPKEAINRNPQKMLYAQGVFCCIKNGYMSKEEIEEVLKKGVINFSKSQPNKQPCAVYTVQGRTGSGKYLRVILEQCAQQTIISKCSNIEKSFDCFCPGPQTQTTPL